MLFFELVEFLLDNMIFDVADFALNYVKEKNSDRYFMTLARIRVMQGNYPDAV